MKVVLDTNVVVSAAMTAGGTCAQIVNLLADGAFDLCADERILDEYEAVLYRRELGIRPEDAAVVLEWIRSIAEPVAAVPLAASLPDPGDLPFLETAAAGGAVLVTGNLRHFPKKACKGTTVLSPRDFLDLVRHAAS
jgi:uncharacterized protein